jgi:hypothetical protein
MAVFDAPGVDDLERAIRPPERKREPVDGVARLDDLEQARRIVAARTSSRARALRTHRRRLEVEPAVSKTPRAPSVPPVDPATEPVDHTDRPSHEGLPNPAGKDPEIGTGPGSDTSTPAPAGSSDRMLLEGPQSRLRLFLLLLRSLRDFIRGFGVVHFVGPWVTFFGWARFHASHP